MHTSSHIRRISHRLACSSDPASLRLPHSTDPRIVLSPKRVSPTLLEPCDRRHAWSQDSPIEISARAPDRSLRRPTTVIPASLNLDSETSNALLHSHATSSESAHEHATGVGESAHVNATGEGAAEHHRGATNAQRHFALGQGGGDGRGQSLADPPPWRPRMSELEYRMHELDSTIGHGASDRLFESATVRALDAMQHLRRNEEAAHELSSDAKKMRQELRVLESKIRSLESELSREKGVARRCKHFLCSAPPRVTSARTHRHARTLTHTIAHVRM